MSEIDSKKVFLRPFIRWAGGKQNLIKEIYENIALKGANRYFEPFLGGASFFLMGNFKEAFLSDLNSSLINCYQQIKNDPESVHLGLSSFQKPVEAKLYYDIRKKYNKNINENTVEQAIRFIFLNKTSFNGIYRVNKLGEYNVPFGKPHPSFPSLVALKKISLKLQSAQIFHGSYESILELVEENDLVYLDPPYPKLSNTAYFNNYTLDKFEISEQGDVAKFAEDLSARGCRVVISNADIPEIRDLYSEWAISECSAYRYVSCKKDRIKVKELIIKNF